MPCFSAASTAGHRSGMPRDTSHRQPVRARASSSCASLLGRPRRHIAATALAASGLTRIISRTARITACSACLAPIAPSPPAACPESAAILRPGPAHPPEQQISLPPKRPITGPIRRRSISQRQAPGSHRPPALRMIERQVRRDSAWPPCRRVCQTRPGILAGGRNRLQRCCQGSRVSRRKPRQQYLIVR